MKRVIFVVFVVFAIAAGAVAQRRGFGRFSDSSSQPLAGSPAEKRILDVQQKMASAGETFLNVPMSDGRMLRVLTESAGAKSVVEIGTSTGYSGLWLCLGLQANGGRLTTLEIDPGRAAQARRHFQQAGVDNIATVVEGDAHQNVTKLKGPVDVVFIDADKEGYLDYLNKMLPLVRPGGLILAHNVESAPDYVQAVTTNPALETTFYAGSLGITLKKR